MRPDLVQRWCQFLNNARIRGQAARKPALATSIKATSSCHTAPSVRTDLRPRQAHAPQRSSLHCSCAPQRGPSHSQQECTSVTAALLLFGPFAHTLVRGYPALYKIRHPCIFWHRFMLYNMRPNSGPCSLLSLADRSEGKTDLSQCLNSFEVINRQDCRFTQR
jgi:hypothetical protein